jgi:hypothetical protein
MRQKNSTSGSDFQRVLVTADISYIDAPDTVSPRSRGLHKCLAETLYHLLRLPLGEGTELPVQLVDDQTCPDLTNAFYKALGTGREKPLYADWAATQVMVPSPALTELFRATYGGAFVVGVCLSALCKTTLASCGIPWLDIALHPARYLKNLICECGSNRPDLRAWLRQIALPQQIMLAGAAREIARYVPN